MQKEHLEELIKDSLKARPDLFVVALHKSQGNDIRLVIDGDQPVSINDCTEISRAIERALDLEELDFSIEVASAGISSPLMLPRQYKKNIGRKLKVKTEKEQYKATLIGVDEEGIELQWKQREPKPVGKGKHMVQKQLKLPYEEIKQAKVMITFK